MRINPTTSDRGFLHLRDLFERDKQFIILKRNNQMNTWLYLYLSRLLDGP